MNLENNELLNKNNPDEEKTIDLASVIVEANNKEFSNMVANMDETIDLKDIKDKITNEINK